MTTADGPFALEARGVTKRYGPGVVALAGLDLRIPPNTITALVGPNGAGKSTLIKAWVGFERPSDGRVLVLGVDPFHDRRRTLTRVAYVPQTAAVYGELTVADHIDLVSTLRPHFDRAQVEQRLVHLGVPLVRRAAELSGGQKAQLNLALALGARADILLLDEPLANLDPLARREFLHVLTEAMRSTGATALLSSHIVTDIEHVCDHLVVLGGGRVLLASGISEATSRHAIRLNERPMAGSDEPISGSVGSFFDPQGRWVTLLRMPKDGEPVPRGARPATLEEVVLGYLASERPPHAAPEDAAA